jgi:hypothetical protein
MMLRHTALFLYRDTSTEEQKLVAKKGLAYMSYACPMVRALDFGSDLLGGSSPMIETKPWERTPVWRARETGPPFNWDMSLHLDFDDQEGMDAYNKDAVHHEVAVYNESVCRPELTARIDWWYDGPPRIEKGLIRHTSLFHWRDDASERQKDDVREAFRSLNGAVPSLKSLVTGDGNGHLATDYDLIVDAIFGDLADFEACREHAAYREALALAIDATKYEWTARLTARMASG